MRKLEREFYKRTSIEVSKDLLGKYLVHRIDGEELKCMERLKITCGGFTYKGILIYQKNNCKTLIFAVLFNYC